MNGVKEDGVPIAEQRQNERRMKSKPDDIFTTYTQTTTHLIHTTDIHNNLLFFDFLMAVRREER